LRIKPLRELEKLRQDEKSEANVALKSEAPYVLRGISGDAVELKVSFQPGSSKEFGVEVYCDAEGKYGFPIMIKPAVGIIRLGKLEVPFQLKAGEAAELRVFLDKNMIEVFANDRQAAVASHKYTEGRTGIQLISLGGDAVATEVKGWKMKSTYVNGLENR
jgi:beta-fructofuranosidase